MRGLPDLFSPGQAPGTVLVCRAREHRRCAVCLSEQESEGYQGRVGLLSARTQSHSPINRSPPDIMMTAPPILAGRGGAPNGRAGWGIAGAALYGEGAGLLPGPHPPIAVIHNGPVSGDSPGKNRVRTTSPPAALQTRLPTGYPHALPPPPRGGGGGRRPGGVGLLEKDLQLLPSGRGISPSPVSSPN